MAETVNAARIAGKASWDQQTSDISRSGKIERKLKFPN
jgi:hypothetical protein